MASDGNGSDRRPGPDELVVPFIFVPQGHPPPSAWIAEHPDHIRASATLVPRGASPPPRWPQAAPANMHSAPPVGSGVEARPPPAPQLAPNGTPPSEAERPRRADPARPPLKG